MTHPLLRSARPIGCSPTGNRPQRRHALIRICGQRGEQPDEIVGEPFDRLELRSADARRQDGRSARPWPDHQTQRKMHALLKAGDGADRQVGRLGDRVPRERCANRIVFEYDHRIEQGCAGRNAAPASNVFQPAPGMVRSSACRTCRSPNQSVNRAAESGSHPARQRVGTQNPTIRSMPARSPGRPAVVIPNTTSPCSPCRARTKAQAP